MWSLTDVDNVPLTHLTVLGDTRMKELLSDASKFKEIAVEPGKEINLLLQHEGNLIEFLKQVKSSVTTDLYKHLYPQGSQPGIM